MSIRIRNSPSRWGAVAQLFHWTIVAMIIGQFLLANIAEKLPAGVAKLGTLAHHKSVGITILGLAVLRLLWRSLNKPSPGLPGDLKPYERVLAHITHHGLYLLLFILPLSGWMMSSAKNYPVSWFGIGHPLPNLVSPNETLFGLLKQTHGMLATALLVIAALHVLGALQHHFVRKDDVLRRMLPFTAKDTPHGAAKLAAAAVAAVLVAVLAFRTLQPAQKSVTETPPPAVQAAPSPAAEPASAPAAESAASPAPTGIQGAVTSAPPATSAPAAAPAPAASAPPAWSSDPASSALEFTFVQAGAATQGSFGKFKADIDFSPGKTPKGRFNVSIETTSVDTRDKERNDQLRTADLFDVANQPRATYVATQFTAKGDGYEAKGKLTLRGVTREVPLTFTFQSDTGNKGATLKGTAAFKRLDFGVGQGEWKSTEWVSDEVQVNFDLHLVPRGGN
jgi:cytochrome b561/polyisoprenoid-binding protein YceI